MYTCMTLVSLIFVCSLYISKKVGNGGTLEFIEGQSPSGSTHAKLTNRNAAWHSVLQDIDISPEDAGLELSTSFYMKIDNNAVSDWAPNKISSVNVSETEFYFDHELILGPNPN